jgi:hypothetical protein
MMLRLKLNDQLVDIASEGLLRPSNNLFHQNFDVSNMGFTQINQV